MEANSNTHSEEISESNTQHTENIGDYTSRAAIHSIFRGENTEPFRQYIEAELLTLYQLNDTVSNSNPLHVVVHDLINTELEYDEMVSKILYIAIGMYNIYGNEHSQRVYFNIMTNNYEFSKATQDRIYSIVRGTFNLLIAYTRVAPPISNGSPCLDGSHIPCNDCLHYP